MEANLKKRIATAVPGALLFLGILWIGGGWFRFMTGLLAFGALLETRRLFKAIGYPDYFLLSLLIAANVWFSPEISTRFNLTIAGILIITAIYSYLRRRHVRPRRWLATLFTGLYAPFGFYMLTEIRALGTDTQGFWLAVILMMMIWGNDIFAYFGGKRFGKRPLAPTISPKKTWEGFYWGFPGAFLGGLMGLLLASANSIMAHPMTVLTLIPAVGIVSVAGPLGDLLESRLKRLAGVKDSSNIIPGHGGIFDRFDSLILIAPLLYFYFAAVVMGEIGMF
ncbi:MAG: phosphatidate cytidylyltransferase [Balneolaceae bacterium]